MDSTVPIRKRLTVHGGSELQGNGLTLHPHYESSLCHAHKSDGLLGGQMARNRLYLMRAKIAKHPLVTFLIALSGLFFLSILVIWLLDDTVTSFGSAILIVLPPFLGQVFENRGLETAKVVISLIGLVSSIGSLAIITAFIVSYFVKLCLKGGRIVDKVKMADHIVVCGWNAQGELVITELLAAASGASHDIVVLAQSESRPVKADEVEFINGDPTQDIDLRRAQVQDARSVIVLTDFTQNPNEADAKALLIALAVESLNQEVHTCVQILNSKNKIHFEHANVDEIICLDHLGGNLAVGAALNHGMSYLISELLTFNSGSELYRYSGKLPNTLVGKTFSQAVVVLAKRHILPLGIEINYSQDVQNMLAGDVLHPVKGEDGNKVIVVNPQGDYRLQEEDVIFLIAESEPHGLLKGMSR